MSIDHFNGDSVNSKTRRNISMYQVQGQANPAYQVQDNQVLVQAQENQSQVLVAPNGMVLSFEFVTPALAAHWLSKNECNRPLRKHVVSMYARDMNQGNWHLIPHAAAFRADGSLGNAQHTLRAILESGKPQWLLVARNVPDNSVAAMDRGIARTISDIARFVGFEFESRRALIARFCEIGFPKPSFGYSQKFTFHEAWNVYQKHKEVVDFAFALSPQKKEVGVNATLLGVIARAAYHHDRNRLAKFVEIVKTGLISGPGDHAAIRYRDWARGDGGAAKPSPREIYKKAQAALKFFLNESPMTKLYGMEGDYFSIPIGK